MDSLVTYNPSWALLLAGTAKIKMDDKNPLKKYLSLGMKLRGCHSAL